MVDKNTWRIYSLVISLLLISRFENILPKDFIKLFLGFTYLQLPLVYLFKKYIFDVDKGAVAMSRDPSTVLPLKLSVCYMIA